MPLEFKFASDRGDVLAVGGPEKLLYVGDEQRVQEINTEGELKGEIPSAVLDTETGCSAVVEGCRVTALAVDSSGTVYLSDNAAISSPNERIRIFARGGGKEEVIEVRPRHQGRVTNINAMAIDLAGRLAVTASESEGNRQQGPFGIVYETGAGLGHVLPEFTLFPSSRGIAFDTNAGPFAGYLFGVNEELGGEVTAYKPVTVAELVTKPLICVPGVSLETDATLDCTLNGEVNPENVANTEVWFEWGTTPELGETTAHQAIATGNTTVPVSAEVGVVRPNEGGFYDQMVGHDEVLAPSEALTSDEVSSTTPIVAPVVVGSPEALFVKAASAVMRAELNPENASTTYFFEYGQGEALAKCPGVINGSCPGVATTVAGKSSVYGKIAISLEAQELQAGANYRYRLFTQSENNVETERQQSMGPESGFATAPIPRARAVTSPVMDITATSAVISGVVDPDGDLATYTFMLGVDAGSLTQYGIVLSGLAEGTEPIERSLTVIGLQPATTYAYKIATVDGSGRSEGEPVVFTTLPQSAVVQLPALVPMLPVPKISFPRSSRPLPKCKPKFVRDKQGRCVKTKNGKRKGHKRKRK